MLNRSGINKARLVGSLAGLILCSGAATPASAQIYSWRDANGNLVLSNHKQAGLSDVKSYAVPRADAIRVTRYVPGARLGPYDSLINEHAQLNGVRTDLVRAVVQVESAYNPLARSPKGALGLMQLMPGTIRAFGVKNAFNPAENIRAGVAYLRQLLNRFEGDEALALAAYNAGPGAVDKYGRTVPPYAETKNYVARVNEKSGARPVSVRDNSIYKTTELVDGRPVTRYTDKKPDAGAFETIGSPR